MLALLSDPRVSQFWDKGHLVSKSFIRTAKATPGFVKPEDREVFRDGQVAWDLIALFPPGQQWDDFLPAPAFYGLPVVNVIEEFSKRLDLEK
ncbi:MAG: hypothetical protein ACHQM4_08345 [Thermoanaerobaculia bacterium]